MDGAVTIADLARDPADVAARLPEWARGDPDEAIGETLALSARSVFQRAYVAWVWAGVGPDGTLAWALPIRASDTERFAPRPTMRVLTRCLRAALDCGADPAALRLIDWEGFTAVAAPGIDPVLAPIALQERNPDPGRVACALMPDGVVIDGPPLDLGPIAPTSGGGGLVALGQATRAHPVTIALALAAQGWALEEEHYPTEVLDILRHRGIEGPAEVSALPSRAIEDDPCPRRRHARRVLRRLLHKRKVGAQYHTEFAHLARGAPPEDRADALLVGEALLRAGLLGEKPSVGQRHVYLRREALPAIHALIADGATSDPGLASEWTAPAPGD